MAKDVIVEAYEKLYGGEVPEEMHETLTRQGEKLFEALHVFVQREGKYKDGWKERGWKGNVCDILRKSKRIRSMFWDGDYNPEEDSDDVVDLMNYCAFFLRNVGDGNRTGA